MTDSEAIERQVFAYKTLKNNNQAFFVDNHEDAERIINALEKQIPKKIKETKECKYGYIPVCGVCNGIMDLMQGELNYCPNCGQKLDWSDEE